MIINSANLDTIRVGFSAAYERGLKQGASQYALISTTVPSSTRENKYGWMGKLPNMREWLGPRAIQNISEHDYSIANRDFELTIGVDRNDIEDDNLGVYTPLFTEMGESVVAHPDQLVWALLAAGFATNCYDGQYFFDTDHPVLDANGNETSFANTDGGAGTGWFLASTKRSLKPIIFQERRKAQFVAKDKLTDDNVFNLREFRYGTDARYNVGYGFPQMCWGSKQTLNKANYKIAREAIMGMTGDHARPLGLMPDTLFVPPSLEGEALEILNAERDNAGATNVYKGTAKLEVIPWLAA